jgi:hypothetical protein
MDCHSWAGFRGLERKRAPDTFKAVFTIVVNGTANRIEG